MKPESNYHTLPRGAPTDSLEMAEELRSALADAAGIAAALRTSRMEKNLVTSVVSNMKQLNLADGGTR